jgi:hypothetical protein
MNLQSPVLATLVAFATSCLPAFMSGALLDHTTEPEEYLLQKDFDLLAAWTHLLGEDSPLAPWLSAKVDPSFVHIP